MALFTISNSTDTVDLQGNTTVGGTLTATGAFTASSTVSLVGQVSHTLPAIGDYYLFCVNIPTITALAGATKVLVVAPFGGTVNKVSLTVDAAFTSTNIVATGYINATAITTGAVTVNTSGSAALSTATVTPTAANTFTTGQVLNVTVTGGVGTCGGTIQMLCTRTS